MFNSSAGDTSRAPQIVIAIEAHGFVPAGQALERAGAKTGDHIFVTGPLGDAGWHCATGKASCGCWTRNWHPVPSAWTGRRHASRKGWRCAALLRARLIFPMVSWPTWGISSGMSHVGARLELARLPLSPAYRTHLAEVGWDVALANGDDYELCFTVPPGKLAALEQTKTRFPGITEIGLIESESGVRILDAANKPYVPKIAGHDHF